MKPNTLYDIDLNPTPLMDDFIKDIQNSGIHDVMEKYLQLLPQHEVVGFISSQLHLKSAIYTIRKRCSIRENNKDNI